MKKTKGLMAFALFVAFIVVGGVMALPSITVNVQQAAMGDGTIGAPVNTASVNLVLSSDATQVIGVDVSFDQALTGGSVIYVYALDQNGAVLDYGSKQLSADLAADNKVTVNFNNPVQSDQIFGIRILVLGPQL